MEKRKLCQMSFLITTAIVMTGCFGTKTAKPTVTTTSKPTQVVEASASVSDLKAAGFGTIALNGKKSYSQNQAIQFAVDTRGKTGYLYIVYVDEKGQTALLYPNEKSPLTELNGKYLFPRDFGGMHINATKDCKGCEQEKTTVYAILSKDKISDIKNITASQLGVSTSPKKSQGKGLSMSLAGNGGQNANINVGKIEFFVK
ncbi:DUF4384 domain-containing protein [Sulfurovum sp. bin170]|uniref:DUF4384 domain-containing protein n=1 Tax=Sulfurovum sp. bin170 TaxID=2695268 RepID=UPI0013DFA68C|nr:DUF4384 domain-containing protein [Sulfurovum sp. bin170]NEW61294.1 DUF4384 domain-containing protein [Sulfurovum sp. bin170]